MASKSKTIKNALITLLKGLQLNGEAAFVAVKGHPRGSFDGFPQVRVLPGDQTTEKGAYGQNDRTVSLTARVHIPYTDDGSEFDYMYELTDLILDALDTEDYSGSFNSDNGTYVLNTQRGDWFDEDTPTGPVLTCEVSVDVSYSKDD